MESALEGIELHFDPVAELHEKTSRSAEPFMCGHAVPPCSSIPAIFLCEERFLDA